MEAGSAPSSHLDATGKERQELTDGSLALPVASKQMLHSREDSDNRVLAVDGSSSPDDAVRIGSVEGRVSPSIQRGPSRNDVLAVR